MPNSQNEWGIFAVRTYCANGSMRLTSYLLKVYYNGYCSATLACLEGMLTDIENAALGWLHDEKRSMVDTVVRWAGVNTHTFNLQGLADLGRMLERDLAPLEAALKWTPVDPFSLVNDRGERIERELGRLLVLQKRPHAPRRALLMIHTDTVYPLEGPAQTIRMRDDHLYGQGVADAKGGIAVLLWSLLALERFSPVQDFGWTVLLNPDEEIGSPGSMRLLESYAQGHDIGLVFEPCLPNGALVGARKGSGNFSIIVKGKAAHAGREFHAGINAIVGLSQCIQKLDRINHEWPDVTLNVGRITGGGPLNVVPDLAIGHFNVRVKSSTEMVWVADALEDIVKTLNAQTDYHYTLHGQFYSPPKPMDARHESLFQHVFDCGRSIGMHLQHQPTGGVCDGNKLAAYGLPTVDTLGVQGGDIHSPEEYCLCDSFPQRAQLTFLLLNRFANQAIRLE